MAKRRGPNPRVIARIRERAQHRCEKIGEFIVDYIATTGPVDTDRRPQREAGPHLRDSYYWSLDAARGGAVVVATNRRYWKYVEYGTAEHGSAQPHVRPAIEAAKARF